MLAKKSTKGRPPTSETTKGVSKGCRLQISHTISPDLLSKVDRLAAAMGQSRAAVINLAVYRLLEQELTT